MQTRNPFARLAAVALAAVACAAAPAHPLGAAHPLGLSAGTAAAPDATAAILATLGKQAADWNAGDLDAFATGYKKSPDILFIGKTVRHGYDEMLAGYRAGYGTRAKMGTLTFTQLAAQPLDARFATATGHFHLERTVEGGGSADGYFLLVLEKTGGGWKIVRDDSTELPPPK